MKIFNIIGFVVLSLCIFLSPETLANQGFKGTQMGSNVQISDLQTQKKNMILDKLEKANLISTEIKKLGKDKQEDVVCLALNMYHENRGSSIYDQIASTYVVFNRMETEHYNSICDVVFKRWQFCWTNGEQVSVPKEIDVWNKIQHNAYKMYINPIYRKLANRFKLKHYVASYMIPMKNKPKWIDKRYFKLDIGKHSYISLDKDDLHYKNNMLKSVNDGYKLLNLKINIIKAKEMK